jgi:tripartite-type tricarboxylate transporter receptor subunit TctC
VAPPLPRVDPDAAARGDYALAERANSRAGWDAFLQRYPSGYYADLARAQRDRLAALDARPPAPRPEPAPVPQAVPPQPQAAPNLNPVAVPSANFPTRPIRVIVPFAAGGTADIVARLVSEGMSRSFGQAVVIENRPGAGGAIGMQAVSSAAADGYTVVVASNAAYVLSPLVTSAAFDIARDFAPVGQIATSPQVLIVSASSKARTLRDFIDQARAARPVYASSGIGTLSHVAMAQFASQARIEMTHVPYRGAAPALEDLSAGRLEAMLTELSAAAPLISSGKLRALAVAGPRRSTKLPSVPTMAEAGLPGFEAALSYGMLAPKNTPPAVIAKLNAVLRNSTIDVRAKLSDMNLDPVPGTAEDFARAIAAESARWAKIVRDAGIKAN